jgi:hypothetical protein
MWEVWPVTVTLSAPQLQVGHPGLLSSSCGPLTGAVTDCNTEGLAGNTTSYVTVFMFIMDSHSS